MTTAYAQWTATTKGWWRKQDGYLLVARIQKLPNGTAWRVWHAGEIVAAGPETGGAGRLAADEWFATRAGGAA